MGTFPPLSSCWLAVAIALSAGTARDAFGEQSPAAATPLTAPGDIVALATIHRERWVNPKGTWDFRPDGVTGAGDSRITFRGPFKAPFTLEFRVEVLKGMRPRVYLGPVTWANEAYERTFALYPSNGDGVPFSYEENHAYEVRLAVERNGVLMTIDGRKIMTAPATIDSLPEIKFSGGDWWSKGTTRFSEIVIRPRPEPAVEQAKPIDHGPSLAAPKTEAAAALPADVQRLEQEFARVMQAIDAEKTAAITRLKEEYARQLDTLASQLSEQGRKTLAMAARVEKARVQAGQELTEEGVTRAPFEVLAARTVYLEKLRGLTRDFEDQAAQGRARNLAAMEELATGLAARDEAAAMALRAAIEKERSAQPAAPLAARESRRTRAAGGDGGAPFEDFPGGDAVLSGLVLHTGDFAGHLVITAVQPIFRTSARTFTGPLHGVPRKKSVKLEAAPGYGIGGLNVHSGDRIDGLEILFMKIKPAGLGLDPNDSYKSEWVGGKGGGPGQIGTGNLAVGIFGATGAELDSIGLIEQLASAKSAIAQKPRAAPVKEVTRENPAALTVVNITAATLVEAASRDAGKWMRVPAALRGANIFANPANKHNGVADYKVTKPGRVYLACNWDYQGNRSGGWTEQRWTQDDFVENGWALIEGVQLVSWENRTFAVFTKELKQDETGRLRCNKYEPPYFITFQP